MSGCRLRAAFRNNLTVRIAALYDIHGNAPALEAVLSEIKDVDLILIGGDVVWGPWPGETLAMLQALRNTRFILGNTDRDVYERAPNGKHINDWCADRLTSDQLDFLRSWPATLSIDGVLFCHGSPRSDTDRITMATPAERVLEWCNGVNEKTIVCGHTHAQFERRLEGRMIIAAGSVGNPFGDPGGYWATFDSKWQLRFTRYDTMAVARRILASRFPRAERLARELRAPDPIEQSVRTSDTA
jgi:diadenosine tetraphosphatase ApaH/serine/threonine PP2A family protein phosphatase